MKNQYLGDVGDYGKYGLLRFLKESGIDIGVNWFLTPDDGGTSGNLTEYLSDECMRVYDPVVYDAMQRLAFSEDKTIEQVEREAMFRGVRFYHAMMDFSKRPWYERTDARMQWHQDALRALQDAALIFANPDNGLSMSQKPTRKDAQKYILPTEIVDYFKRGQQVVYYHHRSRKNAEDWQKELRQIKDLLPDARLLALSFHRWSARTYIFVVHEDEFGHYARLVNDFLYTKWGTHLLNGTPAFTAEAGMDSAFHRIGVAEGKFKSPVDFDADNDEIAEMLTGDNG